MQKKIIAQTQAKMLRPGNYIMINNHPCQITEIENNTLLSIKATSLWDKRLYNTTHSLNDKIWCPIIQETPCQITEIDPDDISIKIETPDHKTLTIDMYFQKKEFDKILRHRKLSSDRIQAKMIEMPVNGILRSKITI
jgi:translation elongation factor P/translation initiation factor 5A